MYHSIVRRIARKNFERINRKDYEAVLKDCAPNVRHRFGGMHALGGARHDRETLGRWFARLGRVMPKLQLNVQDVWVKGWPWNTLVIARWEATATLADGSPYLNRGVHLIMMRWGKVFDFDVHENSQVVAESLAVQAKNGFPEAVAGPIVS